MSQFTKEPAFKLLDSGEWSVVEGFRYYIGYEGSSLYVDVPEGLVTDFASIPRFLWWLWSPTDPRWAKAAVVHDYLGREDAVIKNDIFGEIDDYTQQETHSIFYEAMGVTGAPYTARILFFIAVSIFAKDFKTRKINATL